LGKRDIGEDEPKVDLIVGQLLGDIFNLILFIQALFDAFFRDLPFR
jgi:hypothetical protein